MNGMFNNFGRGLAEQATTLTIPDFPTGFGQNATNMLQMFYRFGYNSQTKTIALPDFPGGFGKSSAEVVVIRQMFAEFGGESQAETITLGSFPA
jgi:hypothetical protein